MRTQTTVTATFVTESDMAAHASDNDIRAELAYRLSDYRPQVTVTSVTRVPLPEPVLVPAEAVDALARLGTDAATDADTETLRGWLASIAASGYIPTPAPVAEPVAAE